MHVDTHNVLDKQVAQWCEAYDGGDSESLLQDMIGKEFPGRIALMSSFGAEAAVLVDMVASIDPATPVYFFDTLKLFQETYTYFDDLCRHVGLTDVRVVRPDVEALSRNDKAGDLWRRDGLRCCHIRKVEPWERTRDQSGMRAWITGRKRFHGANRSDLPLIEREGDVIKINPLADWRAEDIRSRMVERSLPAHPLVAKGYLSIGCEPCTLPATDTSDPRGGRWDGQEKTECGLHSSLSKGVGQ